MRTANFKQVNKNFPTYRLSIYKLFSSLEIILLNLFTKSCQKWKEKEGKGTRLQPYDVFPKSEFFFLIFLLLRILTTRLFPTLYLYAMDHN